MRSPDTIWCVLRAERDAARATLLNAAFSRKNAASVWKTRAEEHNLKFRVCCSFMRVNWSLDRRCDKEDAVNLISSKRNFTSPNLTYNITMLNLTLPNLT